MANPTITNRKTSFDADSNSDYSPRTSTQDGNDIQHVFYHLPSIAHTRPEVDTSSDELLAENLNRLPGGWLENHTSTDVWIGVGATAVLNQGSRLRANGGVWHINCTDQINGITASGTINIEAFEPTHTDT